MLVVENEAQSVAESFNIDPATVSSTALEPVPEDASIAKAHQATYPTITALSLDEFPRSLLNTASADEEDRAIPAGNGSSGTEEEDGDSASDTDSD